MKLIKHESTRINHTRACGSVWLNKAGVEIHCSYETNGPDFDLIAVDIKRSIDDGWHSIADLSDRLTQALIDHVSDVALFTES